MLAFNRPAGTPRERTEEECQRARLTARRPGDATGVYLYMDALRAVLAGLVAFGHAWALLIQDYAGSRSLTIQALYGIAGLAHAAVILFLVLSGYWMTRSVSARERAGWSWKAYLVDRLARLAVVVVPALALGGLLDAVSLHVLQSPTHLGLTDSWVLRKNVGQDLSLGTLAGNLLFLQGIIVQPFGTNGPLWSIAAEFWFYLWFPALFLLVRRGRPNWGLLSLAVVPFAPWLLGYFAIWLCGALLVPMERALTVQSLPSQRVGRVALLITAAATAAALLLARMGMTFSRDVTLAVAFAAFILTLLVVRPVFPPVLRGLATFGARSSFSLYAIHFPVIALLAAFAIGRERLPASAANVLVVIAAVLASIAVSMSFAMATEAHTPRVRDAIRRRLLMRSVIPSGAQASAE